MVCRNRSVRDRRVRPHLAGLIPARRTEGSSVLGILGLLCQKLRDPVDELFGGVDRRAGAVERYGGVGSQSIIGNRLDVVGLRQELAQLATEPRLVSR